MDTKPKGSSRMLVALALGCLLTGSCAHTGKEHGVTLRVHGLDSKASKDAVMAVVERQPGVSSVTVDQGTGQVAFQVSEPGSTEQVVQALTNAGYQVEVKKQEHPEHPGGSEHPEDPEHPEHPE